MSVILLTFWSASPFHPLVIVVISNPHISHSYKWVCEEVSSVNKLKLMVVLGCIKIFNTYPLSIQGACQFHCHFPREHSILLEEPRVDNCEIRYESCASYKIDGLRCITTTYQIISPFLNIEASITETAEELFLFLNRDAQSSMLL